MRTPFDKFAKETWTALLERAGKVETQLEVSAETQFVDLAFEPDTTKLGALSGFGLAARMVGAAPVLFEFFHQAPAVDEVLTCIAKLAERRRRRRGIHRPHLWIVSAGRPSTALAELGFVRAPSWPSGTYELSKGFRTRLVVVGELPRTRETLLLRVLDPASRCARR